MIDYLGFIAIKFFSFVFCALPIEVGLFIGRGLGRCLFFLNKKRRIIAYANLKAAFSREKSPAEIKKIAKGAYLHLGQIFIEILRFPAMNKEYIRKYINIRGFEIMSRARANNKGIVVITAHFGSWELSNLIGGLLDMPISVLVREQKHSRLNDLLNSYRGLGGCKVITKGASTRQLIRVLKDNEIVGILADQDAGKIGTFVDFFGRPASTHSGAFVFAQKTDAQALPVFMVRENGPYHRVDALEPINLGSGKDAKKDITNAVQEFTSALESYIREHPEQWLWAHKRWKSTPKRSIVILSDGKQGHLNQSVAVANIMKRYRQDRGVSPENTQCKVIEVKYKTKFRNNLLGLCSRFASSRCQGCLRCVRFCLSDKTYKELTSVYADLIISCGNSVAPVSQFLKKELNAKNIVIMKPTGVSEKRFNLAIIPRHDSPKARKNVIITSGSPNGIDRETIAGEADRFSSFVKLSRPDRIGLLLGGGNANYEMKKDMIKEVISQIEAASEELDMDILVTTSRRTPKPVEDMLKSRLSKLPRCKLLVIANEKNIDGTIPAILGMSTIVCVSGESSSMVSEAASSGRHVLVFELKKKQDKRTRHDKLLQEFNRQGFIKIVETDTIGKAIKEAMRSKARSKALNDNEKIYKAVGKLL